MNTPLTCTEPLVWTCKACGHSFHAEEWQSHGRQCPACTEKRGEWKCSLCLGSFAQPALGKDHPCKKSNTSNTACSLDQANAVHKEKPYPVKRLLETLLIRRYIVILLGSFIALGIIGLLVNIKYTQTQQDRKLTSLYTNAQKVATAGRWSEAILMYQEMEKLASTPEWSFKSKYEQTRILIKMGSFSEAESKLNEAEMILHNNPDILGIQNLQEKLLIARRDIAEEQKRITKNTPLSQPADPDRSLHTIRNDTPSVPLSTAETDRRAEMTTLLERAKSLFQKEDYLGALQGFTELDAIAQEYPNLQFAVKKSTITCLLALKRFLEAEEKLSEMEAMASANNATRESPDIKRLLDSVRQEIVASRQGSGQSFDTLFAESPKTTPMDKSLDSALQPVIKEKKGSNVRWNSPVEISKAGFGRLELIFKDCMPQGNVSIPFARGVEIYNQEIESVAYSGGQDTILTYVIRMLGKGPFIIPAFKVKTSKGLEEVSSFSFTLPSKIASSTGLVPPKKTFRSIP